MSRCFPFMSILDTFFRSTPSLSLRISVIIACIKLLLQKTETVYLMMGASSTFSTGKHLSLATPSMWQAVPTTATFFKPFFFASLRTDRLGLVEYLLPAASSISLAVEATEATGFHAFFGSRLE